ncbi:MAG: hypothetical protein C0622_06420 [Desulfuromonas sp.]|nr:MAG: hypothetical protein C0622_06420 [Desulfuromonas sp.]
MKIENEQNRGIFSGVMMGYVVLLLHVLLMIALGVAVVLIKGVYDFRWLIFIAGIALIAGSGYYFYHYFKQHKQALREFMSDPALQDRTVEVSLLGGMASVKLGHRDDNIKLIQDDSRDVKQLDAPKAGHMKELSELSHMLEEGLISREEFDRLKKEILDA